MRRCHSARSSAAILFKESIAPLTGIHMSIVKMLTMMLIVVGSLTACATTRFERELKAGRWTNAAAAFDSDSSLHTSEQALFRAAMLHSFPNKETYNPTLARTLFQRLLRLYPSTSYRQAALDQLSALNEMRHIREESTRREREIQGEMVRLIAGTQGLLAQIDSLTRRVQSVDQQNEQMKKQIARLEADLRDREEQLRTLRAELSKLKEIDLNSTRR
jgi:peptidoglycan hydrolase CwlO-like protein